MKFIRDLFKGVPVLIGGALFLCAGTAAASAFSIAAAIIGATALSGTVATVATYVLATALTIAGSLAFTYLETPGKTQTATSNSGVQQQVKLGGSVYHDFSFGLVATKGHYIYWNTSGTNNSRLDQVYVLSTGWCNELKKLFGNGESLTLTQTDSGTGWVKYAVTLPDDGGTRRMWVTFWDGRPDQVYNPTLVSTSNPAGRWTTSHIGAGDCYVHVEADYDANIELFRSLLNGSPLLFEFEGLRLYDPRLDTTAGGSGSHRFDDPATWEYSANPALAKYLWERGIYINGELSGGMGVPSYDLLTDLYIAAANVCDESVALDGGGSENRYELSLIASDGSEHIDAIDSMVAAMAGMRVERQGLFGVIAGGAQTSVATITDADLIADAPVKFTAKRTRTALFNEFYGQYTDPDNLWDSSDIAPYIGGTAIKTADGGKTRPTEKNFNQVTSPTQAQRLLTIAFAKTRMQATAQITLGEEGIQYEPGDWITWNSSMQGVGTRIWLIVGTTHDTKKDTVTFDLEEIAASVYSWTSEDEQAISLPATPGGANSRPTNVSSLSLQATSIAGTNDQELPAIAVSWDAITDETITSVVIDYKIKDADDDTAQRAVSHRPATGDWTGIVISAGVLAGTDYEVRSTITTFPARRVTWSSWYTITTSDNYIVQSAAAVVDAAGAAVGGDVLITDLNEASDLAREARDAQLPVVTGTTGISAMQELVDQVADTLLAQIIRTQRISAQTANSSASIIRVDKAQADGISALASSLETVSTTLGENTASVTVLSESVDGIKAQYTVAVEAGGVTGGYVITGIQLADGTGKISFGIKADEFYIVDPNDSDTVEIPFVISGGQVYIKSAVIPQITADKITTTDLASITATLGSVTTGRIQSPNGKLDINALGANPYILITN